MGTSTSASPPMPALLMAAVRKTRFQQVGSATGISDIFRRAPCAAAVSAQARGVLPLESPQGLEEEMMLWVAVVLIVAALVSFLGGFVLFANGAGVAPQRRTPDDPTGV